LFFLLFRSKWRGIKALFLLPPPEVERNLSFFPPPGYWTRALRNFRLCRAALLRLLKTCGFFFFFFPLVNHRRDIFFRTGTGMKRPPPFFGANTTFPFSFPFSFSACGDGVLTDSLLPLWNLRRLFFSFLIGVFLSTTDFFAGTDPLLSFSICREWTLPAFWSSSSEGLCSVLVVGFFLRRNSLYSWRSSPSPADFPIWAGGFCSPAFRQVWFQPPFPPD